MDLDSQAKKYEWLKTFARLYSPVPTLEEKERNDAGSAVCGKELISYKNGKAQVCVAWKGGKRHGLEQRYFQNGSLYMLVYWEHGKKHGEEKVYCADGQLRHTVSWIAGKRTGIQRNFRWGGTVREQLHWHEDELLMQLEFSDNGVDVLGVTQWKNGKWHGTHKHCSYRTHNLELETNWRDGVKHGCERWFYPDGEKRYSAQWENGVMVGDEIDWKEDGTVRRHRTWENGLLEGLEIDVCFGLTHTNWLHGKKHGVQIKYFADGTAHTVTHWEADLRQGVEKEYYESGILRRWVPWVADKVRGVVRNWNERRVLERQVEHSEHTRIVTGYNNDGHVFEVTTWRTEVLSSGGEKLYRNEIPILIVELDHDGNRAIRNL